MTGIGRRLDGWANHDLNVGAIAGLAPGLDPDLKTEFGMWGPGMYDPRHHAFDGTKLIGLNSPSVPVVIPPIYGLRRVGFETYTGDGPISYWNSYVGVGQMGGQGNFFDPRIGLFISAEVRSRHAKAEGAPRVPTESAGASAAGRQLRLDGCGCAARRLFRQPGRVPPLPLGSRRSRTCSTVRHRDLPVLHDPAVVGTDPVYASRSATGQVPATPLRALWQHPPYFHDGSAPDLPAVVDHYDEHMVLGLTADQKSDLVEFLKSL